ncbi:DUF4174 domain-containing protein [Ascidiimonas sp. W6]|uniref:DUF4174 domain-containing protein n=1 Tax=Ascidiimonas meishanensis TaxID=3128903 RepID=UPI0030EDB4A2
MKRYYLCIILFVCGITKNAYTQELSKHRWNNRLVLLVVQDSSNQLLQRQLEEFEKHKKGLEERKILVYMIAPNGFKKEDESWNYSEALFKKYNQNKTPFEVILLGLDGGIKARKKEIFYCRDLFAIVDAMPMRQNEIRKQH